MLERITISRTVDAIRFRGRMWEVVPVSSESKVKCLSALRSGRLDHVGSCPQLSQGHHSTPQVYDAGASLLAGAVSCTSQFIDVAWWLHPIFDHEC